MTGCFFTMTPFSDIFKNEIQPKKYVQPYKRLVNDGFSHWLDELELYVPINHQLFSSQFQLKIIFVCLCRFRKITA